MASTPTASGRPGDWIHAYTRDFSERRVPAPVHARHAGRVRLLHPGAERGALREAALVEAAAAAFPPVHGRLHAATATGPASALLLRALRRAARRSESVSRVRFRARPVRHALLSGWPARFPIWAPGTFTLMLGFLLVNLLVILEVADRLSLKGELEVAREIQLAMLPRGTYVGGRHRDLRHDAAGEHGRRRFLRRAAAARRAGHRRARRRGRQGQPCGTADGVAARRAAHARGRAARGSGAGRDG